jgi:hypothetical protein
MNYDLDTERCLQLLMWTVRRWDYGTFFTCCAADIVGNKLRYQRNGREPTVVYEFSLFLCSSSSCYLIAMTPVFEIAGR